MTQQERLLKAKIPCAETGIEVKHALCDICTGTYCGIDAYVKDGKVIKIEGTDGHPYNKGKLCPKGASNRQYLYRKHRIQTPLRRVGERGSDEFEPISWDEAYRTIADRLHAIRAEYGAESVMFFAGYPKWYRAWLRRLAYAFGSPNYGTEASTCHMTSVVAWKIMAGQYYTGDLGNNAELYMGWGNNMMISEHASARGLMDFKERGGKIVIIDCRDTVTSQKLADIHIKIHPGTDGALAWGLANVMIQNGWYDKEFVEKYVHGFEPYCAYAKTFTLEKTERITGVPMEQIVSLAELYGKAKKVCAYVPSAAIAHNRNGFNSERAIIALQAITGHIDQTGGELPSMPTLMCGAPSFPTMEEEFVESVRSKHEKPRIGYGQFPAWDSLADEVQLVTLPDQIASGKPYPVKALVSFGMNHRIGTDPKRLLRAMDQLDFVVAADIVMNETCRHADIVLPACTSMERSELRSWGGGYLTCTDQCVEPLYDSKNDAQIMCELSRYLNPEDKLMAAGYEETMRYMISNLSVSLEELRAAPLPLKMKEFVPRAGGAKRACGFETPTGKVELYSETIAAARGARTDVDPLPVWYEGSGEGDPEEFPMTLISGSRIPNAIHSRIHEGMSWPRSLRKEASADIHPKDAERLGLQEGDRIRLRSNLGAIEVGVHITAAGSPGDVYMFHGYAEADVNTLIPATHVDPYTGFPGFNQLRCTVEKAGAKK